MTFHGFLIREPEATDSTIYPLVRDDAEGMVREEADGDDVSHLVASAVEVYTFDDKGPHLGQFTRDVRIQVVVTDSRVAFACPKYAKGGGWRGDPVSMIVLNAGSKLLAAAKRHGKCLVGQVRYPCLVSVGWRSKRKTFSTIEHLRITVQDGTVKPPRAVAIDLCLPRDVSALRVANVVARRAVAHRLADPVGLDAETRSELERIGREGVSAENDGRNFTLLRLPGARRVGAAPSTLPATSVVLAPPVVTLPLPDSLPSPAPPVVPAPVSGPPHPQPAATPPPPPPTPMIATQPSGAGMAEAVGSSQVAAHSTDFLPRFAVLDLSSPAPTSLRALDLRYETSTWFPLPHGRELVVDRLVVKVSAFVGVDSRSDPARRRSDSRLQPAFSGWSTVLVTDSRLVGICVRGRSIAGPVSFDKGTVVGWSFPLADVAAAAVVAASDGPAVAVRSTDDLIGALLLSAPKRRTAAGSEPVALDELAKAVDTAARRLSTPQSPPRPPVVPSPPPSVTPVVVPIALAEAAASPPAPGGGFDAEGWLFQDRPPAAKAPQAAVDPGPASRPLPTAGPPLPAPPRPASPLPLQQMAPAPQSRPEPIAPAPQSRPERIAPAPLVRTRSARRNRSLASGALGAVVVVLAVGVAIGRFSLGQDVVSTGASPSQIPLATIAAGERPAETATPIVPVNPVGGQGATGAISSVPSNDPRELARQVSLVEVTILDPSQPAAQIRDAGRAQQLLLRHLDLDAGLADRVIPLLDPAIRGSVERYLRAGRSISSLVDPQSSYPDEWRIVPPPPADEVKGYFQASEAETGVPRQYLAAVAVVETRMGRIHAESSAGAQGPMQFLPATWEVYGGGGDIGDFYDGAMAAGRLLAANGAPGAMRAALYSYNPSDAYVDTIVRLAQRMIENERQFLAVYEWQVLYKHVSGLALLPEGWPSVPAMIVAPAGR